MKVYKSNILPFAVIFAICGLGYLIIGLTGPLSFLELLKLALYIFIFFSFILFVISLTYVKFLEGGIIEFSEIYFIKKRAKVGRIKKIERGTTYRGTSAFGYSMFLYFLDEHDKDSAMTIAENPFGKKLISDIINDLYKINPNIKFHKHYEKMIKKA